MEGSLEGIQAALPLITESIGNFSGEAWFSSWAMTSNAGSESITCKLGTSGKGKKGGKKGGKDSFCEHSAKGGWKGGCAQGAVKGGAQARPGGPVLVDGPTVMKRTADEIDAAVAPVMPVDGAIVSPMCALFTMKFLFSEAEMQALCGADGSVLTNLQESTGTQITVTRKAYPGTNIVLGAVILGLGQILQDLGQLVNEETNVKEGDAQMKLLVPMQAAKAIIGVGGRNVKSVRELTGIFVHMDNTKVPPGGGDLSEQLLSMEGSLEGIQAALPLITESIGNFSGEAWFSSWAMTSNAGSESITCKLGTSGKGKKGGKKGGKESFCEHSAKGGWKGGCAQGAVKGGAQARPGGPVLVPPRR